jgi:hypothetical protein
MIVTHTGEREYSMVMKRIGLPALLLASLLLAGCDLDIDLGNHRTNRCPDGRCPNNVCPDGHCPIRADGQPDWQRMGHGNSTSEVPAMNLPVDMRMHNYAGGSCVHASTESCLRWQHQYAWADFWRSHYSGGESAQGLAAKFDKNGLKYAYTTSGDTAFLDWCDRTRRGAVIFYYTNHSINFVGHSGGYAYVLDNNREDHYITIEWNEFVRNWRGFGGFALTPVYVPPPPQPRL